MSNRLKDKAPALSRKYAGFMIVTLVIFALAFALLLGGISGTNFEEHGTFIQIITFILAFMPILLVLIGMLGFDLSALKAAPFAFLLAVLLSYTFFANMEHGPVDLARAIWAQTRSGIVSSFYIVGLILFSFLILDLMQTSGAMDIVKSKLAVISGGDRRVQLIIIGLFVPIFMEGAAGAGTPAAIAAPFLVGLGFEPVLAVVVALMADGVCTSFGGSGLTTMSGGADLVSAGVSNTDLNFAAVGMFHMVGILVMPFLILLFAYGKKAFKGKGIVGYSLYCGVVGALLMLVFSNFVGGFVTDMGTGLIGIILAILGLKLFKIETPEEHYSEPPKIDGKPKYSFITALSPYIFVLVILPVVLTAAKYIPVAGPSGAQIPLWNYLVGKLTYNGWIDLLLFLCSLLSIITLKYGFWDYCKAFGRALKKVVPVFVIMASLYSVANIMKIPFISEVRDPAGNVTRESLSMIKLLAKDIAAVTGPLYPAGAVLIGAVGAFITGTNLGANQLFATMHIHAADILGINKIMTFASSNSGGSLGNMICPNNVTAACATVGITGKENKVMKRVVIMFLITFLLYAVLSILFVYVIFPNVSPGMTNVFARMG